MATYDERVTRLIRAISPGYHEVDIVVAGSRIDIVVPHGHGRVPDEVHIVEMSALRIVLEALGVTFPVPDDADSAELLDGTELDTTPIPDGTFREEGAPFTKVHRTTSQYLIVRNWWHEPLDGQETAFRTFALIRRTAQGLTREKTDDPCALVANRVDELVAVPANGAIPLTVEFSPADLNLLTDLGMADRTWTWDFGDGSPEDVTMTPFNTHTYLVANVYTVTLTGELPCAGPIELTVQVTATP